MITNKVKIYEFPFNILLLLLINVRTKSAATDQECKLPNNFTSINSTAVNNNLTNFDAYFFSPFTLHNVDSFCCFCYCIQNHTKCVMYDYDFLTKDCVIYETNMFFLGPFFNSIKVNEFLTSKKDREIGYWYDSSAITNIQGRKKCNTQFYFKVENSTSFNFKLTYFDHFFVKNITLNIESSFDCYCLCGINLDLECQLFDYNLITQECSLYETTFHNMGAYYVSTRAREYLISQSGHVSGYAYLPNATIITSQNQNETNCITNQRFFTTNDSMSVNLSPTNVSKMYTVRLIQKIQYFGQCACICITSSNYISLNCILYDYNIVTQDCFIYSGIFINDSPNIIETLDFLGKKNGHISGYWLKSNFIEEQAKYTKILLTAIITIIAAFIIIAALVVYGVLR